jgi:hypothetical protein
LSENSRRERDLELRDRFLSFTIQASHSLDTLLTQLSHFENLPALGGGEILNAIQTLRGDMNQRFGRVGERLGKLDRRWTNTLEG